MTDEVVLLYTTWPDAESAGAAARTMVGERLCACVNILAPMTSVYRWDDGVQTAAEIPALCKTTAAQVAALRDRIVALHPYETPCVMVIPLSESCSYSPFLDWIRRSVSWPEH